MKKCSFCKKKKEDVNSVKQPLVLDVFDGTSRTQYVIEGKDRLLCEKCFNLTSVGHNNSDYSWFTQVTKKRK
jgi:hypothetical protein